VETLKSNSAWGFGFSHPAAILYCLISFGSLPIKMNQDDKNTARVEGSAFAGGRLPIRVIL
jgi:hypothetical protein